MVPVSSLFLQVWVTREFFRECKPLLEKIKEKVGKTRKHKFETHSDEHDIAFQMIGNNATLVLLNLHFHV